MYLADQLKDRTKHFAIRIVQLCRTLPRNDEVRHIGRQLLRSGTSVAGNHRAVCRARSHAEFVAKMGIVLEETDETVFWLELLVEAGFLPERMVERLLAEARELLAIIAASVSTAKARARRQPGNEPMSK